MRGPSTFVRERRVAIVTAEADRATRAESLRAPASRPSSSQLWIRSARSICLASCARITVALQIPAPSARRSMYAPLFTMPYGSTTVLVLGFAQAEALLSAMRRIVRTCWTI